MNTQQKPQPQNEGEFFDSILQMAKEIVATSQTQAPCINRSRNINNIRVNVMVETNSRPGLLRRLFAKLF